MKALTEYLSVIDQLSKNGCYRFRCPWCGRFFAWQGKAVAFEYPWPARLFDGVHNVTACYLENLSLKDKGVSRAASPGGRAFAFMRP